MSFLLPSNGRVRTEGRLGAPLRVREGRLGEIGRKHRCLVDVGGRVRGSYGDCDFLTVLAHPLVLLVLSVD